jgi:hypothetical protein
VVEGLVRSRQPEDSKLASDRLGERCIGVVEAFAKYPNQATVSAADVVVVVAVAQDYLMAEANETAKDSSKEEVVVSMAADFE